MQLNLTDEEAGVLLNLLTGIIEGDRHPMSRRLNALRRIRAKLPGLPSEMKGVYSSPDAALARYARRSLFTDNTYAHDSGGDPRHILDLTYAQFKQFYDTFYHPSNARLWFYGDDPPAERLRRADEYLHSRARLHVDSRIAIQPRRTQPERQSLSYAAGPDGAGQRRSMVVVNWLLPDPLDAERLLTLARELMAIAR